MSDVYYHIRKKTTNKYSKERVTGRMKNHACFNGIKNQQAGREWIRGAVVDIMMYKNKKMDFSCRVQHTYAELQRLVSLIREFGYEITMSSGYSRYMDENERYPAYVFTMAYTYSWKKQLFGFTLLRLGWESKVFEVALYIESLIYKPEQRTSATLMECIGVASTYSNNFNHALCDGPYRALFISLPEMKKQFSKMRCTHKLADDVQKVLCPKGYTPPNNFYRYNSTYREDTYKGAKTIDDVRALSLARFKAQEEEIEKERVEMKARRDHWANMPF